MTKTELVDFDVSELLDSDEAIVAFLNDAAETGDERYIIRAINVVARAKGMTNLSKESGVPREQLYRCLGEKGNPTFMTMSKILAGMGIQMNFVSAAVDTSAAA